MVISHLMIGQQDFPEDLKEMEGGFGSHGWSVKEELLRYLEVVEPALFSMFTICKQKVQICACVREQRV